MRSAVLATLALLSCASSLPSGAASDPADAPTSTAHATPHGASIELLAGLPDVAERAVQSVVNVSVTKRTAVPADPFRHFFFGPGRPMLPREREQQGIGSGVIVDADDGVVVTNNHVVEGASDVEVTLPDGTRRSAEVVGTDPKSDLAVLRLDDPPAGLTALPVGDSTGLRLGEVVLAIGNPFGVGQTVTMGIVSATGRADVGIVDYEDFIQTDAAINPGNSGGALVNARGELVGINTAIMSRSGGYQGIGFAIPAAMVEAIVADLLDDGTVSRGYLGIRIQDVDEALGEALGLDDAEGIVVAHVEPDSPAEEAGLERGDVIVELDGERVTSTSRFRNAVAAAGPEAEVALVVNRDGKRKRLRATLGALPGSESSGATAEAAEALAGLGLRGLDPDERARLRLPRGRGVRVTSVEPGSRAARSGLREGDVLVEVNRRTVGDPDDVAAALGDGPALLLVLRDGATMYLPLRE